jgi:hypothetical protein
MAPKLTVKERQRPKLQFQAADKICGETSVLTDLNQSPTLKGTMLQRVSKSVRRAGGTSLAASVAVWLLAAVPFWSAGPAISPAMAAENNPAAPPADQQQAAASPDGANVDEYAEAQRVISGPAGNPECVWLGRKAVNRLWNDDIDTAFRDLDLYDRFGCPGAHVQAAVRCIVLHPPVSGDRKAGDQKPSDTLDFRVKACWNSPTSPVLATPAPAPSSPSPAAPSAAAPSQSSAH